MAKLTPDEFQAIFDRIEAGDTLRKILPELAITRSLFFRQIDEAGEGLQDQYARALQQRADSWAEEVHDTQADDKRGSDHKRISVDALKWLAGKAAPKKYGDHLEIGGDIVIRSKEKIDRAVEAAARADE